MNITPSLQPEDICALCGDPAQRIVMHSLIAWGTVCVFVTPVCLSLECAASAQAAIQYPQQPHDAPPRVIL